MINKSCVGLFDCYMMCCVCDLHPGLERKAFKYNKKNDEEDDKKYNVSLQKKKKQKNTHGIIRKQPNTV